MELKKEIYIGKELLKIRSLLNLKRKSFAKISYMTVEEIEQLEENKVGITILQRFKICIALDNMLIYHHEEYNPIVVNEILRIIGVINPFDKIEEFAEVSLMFQTLNRNIDDFVRTHQEHHGR